MNSHAGVKWTDEMDAKMKLLAENGATAQGISDAFARDDAILVSRNAIIGRTHRLIDSGRLKREVSVSAHQRRERKPKPARTHPWRKKAPFVEENMQKQCDPIVFPEGGVLLVDLGPLPPAAEHCRWPLGAERDKAQLFCGQPPAEGLPYCPRHARACYTPNYPRRTAR
jgi:GcrA cell cycle regulator